MVPRWSSSRWRIDVQRRDFLKSLPALAAVPMVGSARSALAGVRAKITDVRIVPLRVVKEVGSLVDFAGGTRSYRLGGGNFVEVQTDQGLVGSGPTMTESELPRLKSIVVGQDPFNIEVLATRLIGTNLRG